jgi:LuxR family transcriptional regulator, quorum-sensing system regulator LasR
MKVASLCIDEDVEISHLQPELMVDDGLLDPEHGPEPEINDTHDGEISEVVTNLAQLYQCDNRVEFSETLQTVIRKFGFRFYYVELLWVAPIGRPLKDVISSYPQNWQSTYANRNYASLDPAMTHCMNERTPIYWCEKKYREIERIYVHELSASHGVTEGVCAAVHQYGGSRTILNLSLERIKDRSEAEQERLKKIAQVLVGSVHTSIGRFTKGHAEDTEAPKLTARELECLEWVAAGKTAWEIAGILGVTEATATFHIKNIIRKLNASNRQHALTLAFHYGLLK